MQKQARLLYWHDLTQLYCIFAGDSSFSSWLWLQCYWITEHMHRGVDFVLHSPCLLLPALFLLKSAVILFWWKPDRTTIPTATVYLAPGVLTGSAPMEVPPPAHLEASMCLRAPGDVSPPDVLSNQQHKGGPKLFVSVAYRHDNKCL